MAFGSSHLGSASRWITLPLASATSRSLDQPWSSPSEYSLLAPRRSAHWYRCPGALLQGWFVRYFVFPLSSNSHFGLCPSLGFTSSESQEEAGWWEAPSCLVSDFQFLLSSFFVACHLSWTSVVSGVLLETAATLFLCSCWAGVSHFDSCFWVLQALPFRCLCLGNCFPGDYFWCLSFDLSWAEIPTSVSQHLSWCCWSSGAEYSSWLVVYLKMPCSLTTWPTVN